MKVGTRNIDGRATLWLDGVLVAVHFPGGWQAVAGASDHVADVVASWPDIGPSSAVCRLEAALAVRAAQEARAAREAHAVDGLCFGPRVVVNRLEDAHFKAAQKAMV